MDENTCAIWFILKSYFFFSICSIFTLSPIFFEFTLKVRVFEVFIVMLFCYEGGGVKFSQIEHLQKAGDYLSLNLFHPILFTSVIYAVPLGLLYQITTRFIIYQLNQFRIIKCMLYLASQISPKQKEAFQTLVLSIKSYRGYFQLGLLITLFQFLLIFHSKRNLLKQTSFMKR